MNTRIDAVKVVLAVDDNATNRALVRARLEAEGFTVLEARDGLEALEVLDRHKVDAVVSDILMPRMDGFRLCHEVRKDGRFDDLVFIIHSATYTSPGDQKVALDSGADRYLRKPCSAADLVAAVRESATDARSRHQSARSPLHELAVMREYSEALVKKLEEKNEELEAHAEQLREQREWLQVTLASIGDGVIAADVAGRIVFINPAAQALTGWSESEAFQQPVRKVFRAADAQTHACREATVGGVERDANAGGLVKDSSLLARNGQEVPIEFTTAPIRTADQVRGVVTVFRDMTGKRCAQRESEQAQEALAASESRLRALLEAVPRGIVAINESGHIVLLNGTTADMFGYDRGDLLGQSLELLLPEDHRAAHAAHVRDYFAHPHNMVMGHGLDLRGRRKGGHQFPLEISLSAIEHAGTRWALAVITDITERKQAEEALRHAETLRQVSSYTRGLLEASLDPVVTISPEGKITDVNEATIRATGVERERLIGTDFCDYFTEPEKAGVGYQQVFSQGFITDYPLTIRHRDGRLTYVLYNASVYKDVRGHVLGVFAAARDITAQKKAEAEVAEQRARERERLAELERFQRLTVGRELKMIELKKEIAEMKASAGSAGTRR